VIERARRNRFSTWKGPRSFVQRHPRGTKIRVLHHVMQLATSPLKMLSDDALLRQLDAVVGSARRLLLRLLDFLNEVENRRLHVRHASSMFDFCRKRLGFSEGEALRRMTAAQLVKRFPVIREWIAAGKIHLTALLQIQKLFRPGNVVALLEEIAGKTKKEVEGVLARHAPQPDVPSSMRKLTSKETAATPLVLALPSVSDARRNSSRSPAVPLLLTSPVPVPVPVPVPMPALPAPAPPIRPSEQMKERSPDRFAVTFTADRELHDKIERLKALMAHTNPTGDIAIVVSRAVDVLLEKIERERLGKTARPRACRESADPGYISNETKRIVIARDGYRCSFVGENGERCTECKFLQFDHRVPRAWGGTGDPTNVRILCRAHNKLVAERAFGREHIERKINQRQQRSAEGRALDSDGLPASERMEAGSTDLRRRGTRAVSERRAADGGSTDSPCARLDGVPTIRGTACRGRDQAGGRRFPRGPASGGDRLPDAASRTAIVTPEGRGAQASPVERAVPRSVFWSQYLRASGNKSANLHETSLAPRS
jgi:hypothetical protein